MIMESADTGVVEGNMPVYKKSTMGISKAAERHIMKQLSSFYNDPIRAVIREYYANAVDSHRKAGTTRPVEIQLPTELQPTFWLRDWGTGMSEDFILDVYNWYGESTKQDEEDSIGHFGFGSKSGFAIAPQFSVISYYNGMKYSINFLKAANGAYDGNIVSARETEEPNGVLVSIPIDQSRVAAFNNTADTFFKYVDPDSVIVNGKRPESIFEDGSLKKMSVDGEFEVWLDIKNDHPYHYSRKVNFVMGGIVYDITKDQFSKSLTRIGVSSLNIGDVSFVIPLGCISIGGTREGVQDTEKTNAILDKCLRMLVDSLKESIQEQIDNLTEYSEVISVFERSMQIVVDTSEPYTYKDKPVTSSLVFDSPIEYIYRAVGVVSGASDTKALNLRGHWTFITGVTEPSAFFEREKNSLLPYVRSVGTSVNFLPIGSVSDLTPEGEEFKLTENKNMTVITYEDFKATVKEYRATQKEAAAARKAAGIDLNSPKKIAVARLAVLDLESGELSWPEVTTLDAKDLVYIWSQQMPEPSHWENSTMRQAITRYLSVFEGEKSYGLERLAKNLKILTDKKKVILLAGTKNPSWMKKHISNVPSIVDEIKVKLDEYEKGLTAESIKKLETASHSFTSLLKSYIPSNRFIEIEDDELREALVGAPVDGGRKTLNDYLQTLEAMRFSAFDIWTIRRQFKFEGGASGTDFRKKYPLLEPIRYSSLGEATINHLIRYVNYIHRDLISETNTATLITTKG